MWAHGADKLFSAVGLCPTCNLPSQHGFIRVRLLTPPGLKKITDGYTLHVTNDKLKVPGGDTTYWCKVVKLPDFISEKVHHIVQVNCVYL